MKPIQLSLLFFIFIGLISCEKEDSSNDQEREFLRKLSESRTVSCDYTGMNSVRWKFSMTNSDGVQYHNEDFLKIEWKEKNTSESWKNKTFDVMDDEAIIDGLKAKTEYQFKFSFCDPAGISVENSTIDFTTRAFDFNYDKIYPGSRLSFSVFSIEDGLHTLYGYGFTNTPLTFRFTQESDASVFFNVTPTVLNDSTLTVKIPSDVIPNDPFEVCKFYKVTVNGDSIMKQYDYYTFKINNRRYENVPRAVSFDIFNKDFVFNGVDISYTRTKLNPFDTYTFKVYLGLQYYNTYPEGTEYYLGVPMSPIERHLIVRSEAKATVASFDLSESASNRDYIWPRMTPDKTYREDVFPYVQRSAGYNLKVNLNPGNYTVQLITKTTAGFTKSSNEYPFTVKAQ